MNRKPDIIVDVFHAPWPQVYYQSHSPAADKYCGEPVGTADPDEWHWLLDARKLGMRVLVNHH